MEVPPHDGRPIPREADRERSPCPQILHRPLWQTLPMRRLRRALPEGAGQEPPQTYDRNAVAGWLCYVHNIVNKRLKKPEFDCNKIGDFYDCGCGDEDKNKEKGADKASPQLELEKP
uniref:Sulfhydryl oxidase n=1 Tax=Bionectria ochroleuca TaxID=29856 RepID=A0A8H7K9S6_BIOOC